MRTKGRVPGVHRESRPDSREPGRSRAVTPDHQLLWGPASAPAAALDAWSQLTTPSWSSSAGLCTPSSERLRKPLLRLTPRPAPSIWSTWFLDVNTKELEEQSPRRPRACKEAIECTLSTPNKLKWHCTWYNKRDLQGVWPDPCSEVPPLESATRKLGGLATVSTSLTPSSVCMGVSTGRTKPSCVDPPWQDQRYSEHS